MEDVEDGKEEEHGSAEASTSRPSCGLIYTQVGAQEAVHMETGTGLLKA
jgi:hypothetical protein